jgi:hypothetical protein
MKYREFYLHVPDSDSIESGLEIILCFEELDVVSRALEASHGALRFLKVFKI